MRIAVLPDIHANLEALEKVFSILEGKHIDQIVCLGDTVGYGANPNECLTLIRKNTSHILLGNHDQVAFDLSAARYFNPHAAVAAQWTHQQLSEDKKQFLQNLPYTVELEGILFVHASPYQPYAWHYIITDADARDNFDHFTQTLCFVGHSHVPEIFRDNRTAKAGSPRGSGIQRNEKYIINVGSIGQPRDGDWRLSFGIFDSAAWSYEHIRSEYDVQAASQKILKAGLPRALAERLFFGR